jgi:hypothetical protein
MARSAALRYIQGQPFVDQITLHMSNSGLYTHDGSEGTVYCFVELKKEEYDGVKEGAVSLAQLLPSLRVKFGCAKDVSHRREGYAKCNAGGHRRLWLFSFPTRHRYRIGEESPSSFPDVHPFPRTSLPPGVLVRRRTQYRVLLGM